MAFWFKTIFLEYHINNTFIKKRKRKKKSQKYLFIFKFLIIFFKNTFFKNGFFDNYFAKYHEADLKTLVIILFLEIRIKLIHGNNEIKVIACFCDVFKTFLRWNLEEYKKI